MVSYAEFCENVARLKERISDAAEKCGRNPSEIKILPVTKNHPVDAAEFAHRAGFKSVGENRVQEALSKIDVAKFDVNWELIGHLQSNKAKFCADGKFARVQSVDNAKLLEKLDTHAAENAITLRILLQINSGRDPAKFGAEIEDSAALVEKAVSLKNLKLEGLMTIAPLSEDRETARRTFAKLREIRDEMESKFSISLPELSMGMSGDIEEAVAEGSTLVRVGTALFGERVYA